MTNTDNFIQYIKDKKAELKTDVIRLVLYNSEITNFKIFEDYIEFTLFDRIKCNVTDYTNKIKILLPNYYVDKDILLDNQYINDIDHTLKINIQNVFLKLKDYLDNEKIIIYGVNDIKLNIYTNTITLLYYNDTPCKYIIYTMEDLCKFIMSLHIYKKDIELNLNLMNDFI